MSNTFVDAGVFTLLVVVLDLRDGAPAVTASAIGFIAGGVNSYLWNSRVTFKSGIRIANPGAIARFVVVLLSGVALTVTVSTAVLAMPLPLSASTALVLAKAGSIVAGAAWNFVLQRSWVFVGGTEI